MSIEPEQRYQIRFPPPPGARSHNGFPRQWPLPCWNSAAALAANPHRVGKPLFGPLAGCHGARRGTYRIVYRIDEDNRTVHVLDIDHRAEISPPALMTTADGPLAPRLAPPA